MKVSRPPLQAPRGTRDFYPEQHRQREWLFDRFRGVARRFARKMTRELAIPLRAQHSNKEHILVDVEHANLLMQVAASHVRSKEDADLVLSGAAKGLAVNRTWLGLMANEMAALPDK